MIKFVSVFEKFSEICTEKRLKCTHAYGSNNSTGLTKANFSKHRLKVESDNNHLVPRDFAIVLGLFLRLDLQEMQAFLYLSGFILSTNVPRDRVIIRAIQERQFNVICLNCMLAELGFSTLTQKKF